MCGLQIRFLWAVAACGLWQCSPGSFKPAWLGAACCRLLDPPCHCVQPPLQASSRSELLCRPRGVLTTWQPWHRRTRASRQRWSWKQCMLAWVLLLWLAHCMPRRDLPWPFILTALVTFCTLSAFYIHILSPIPGVLVIEGALAAAVWLRAFDPTLVTLISIITITLFVVRSRRSGRL